MGLVARVTSNGRASNCTKHRLTLPVLVNESLIIVRDTTRSACTPDTTCNRL